MTVRQASFPALVLLSLAACGPAEPPGELITSNRQRLTSAAPASDVTDLTAGNTTFAGNLHRGLGAGSENLIFSPYSISSALAMTYAGARGETETAMAKALSFSLPQDRTHAAFNALDQALASRGKGAQGKDGKPFRLSIVNQLFGQKGYQFLPAYLDTVAENYGAGLRALDFERSAEPSRKLINDWVQARTEDRIKDLLPEGSIAADTRLVLANAIYFNASWKSPFDPATTQVGPFTLLDGSKRAVPMMRHDGLKAKAVDHADYLAVEIPYSGDEVSMLVVAPKAEKFSAVEAQLSAKFLDAVVQSLKSQTVELAMPRFTARSRAELKAPLTELGMGVAFADADFSGMDGSRQLQISEVFHQAFVAVDEAGTEAAAATAVVMREVSAIQPDLKVSLDRPFLFAIRDNGTGAVLFLGRVVSP